jgi:2-polyprenyl-3-methyl-5-hydroxy-6-metoxy-1,4-benzoquinol methylase
MDHSQQAVSVFNRLAREYEEMFMDVSLYTEPLNRFCSLVPTPEPQVLELGCGPGNVSAYVLKQRPDFRLYGTDLSENMVAIARKNNPSATFSVMDCREAHRLQQSYKGIIASFVLPYLPYEEAGKLVADCASLLQKGGILYLSTIEGAYSSSGPKQSSRGDWVYQHYYLKEDLLGFCSKQQLNPVEEYRIKSVMGNGQEVVDLVVLAQKG